MHLRTNTERYVYLPTYINLNGLTEYDYRVIKETVCKKIANVLNK